MTGAAGARREAHPENRVALEHARMTARAKRVTAEDREAYRRSHPECTTKLDKVVDALIEMERMGGRAK